MKLNDHTILSCKDDSKTNIRIKVKDILSRDGKDNEIVEKLPFELMSDDEADEARKYFGVF